MQTQRLGQRQLLNMMKGNLEKRILQVYGETEDVPSVIEYAVALLVRHALSVADFSFMCHELIRELFLTAVPCTTMRRFSVFSKHILTKKNGETSLTVYIKMNRTISLLLQKHEQARDI